MKEYDMYNRPSVPELYKPEWVVEGELARSQRPGYPKDKPSSSVMKDWRETVLSLGIRSVICIMDQNQVDKYNGIDNIGDGLFSFYKENGLTVHHMNVEDYKKPPLNESEVELVLKAYSELEKPVLIHCSAGKDRTGKAVASITGSDNFGLWS